MAGEAENIEVCTSIAQSVASQLQASYNIATTTIQVRYVGLTSLYMAVMMSDGLDVVTVELELE